MTASALVLRAEVLGDTVTLFISGEIDASNVDELDNTLRLLLDAGPAVLYVDMSQVTFSESVAFQTLSNAARLARDRGCRLVTVGLQAPAMRVVDILGLRTQLGIQPDRPAPPSPRPADS